MDPLSDVLRLLKPHSYMFRGLDAGGAWAIHFDQQQGIRCYAIVTGQCWLAVEGVADVLLTAGDCVLLPGGQGARLASDLSLAPADAMMVFPQEAEGGVAVYNGGGACTGMGGFFEFTDAHAGMLLGVLPAIVHIRKESDKAVLRSAMQQLMQELREPQPGAHLIAQYLGQMMLVQALRLFLAQKPDDGVGWLYALADKKISAALSAMHTHPAQAWTIQTLAECAAMSRSTFALRFKAAVGMAPMDYLTRWRMLLASERLLHTTDPISVIAPALGYESESAFSTAFKRVMGCSPRDYVNRVAKA